jgi:hypothetical protein
MLNNTPIRWISKRQKTVEKSTYGSELVASSVGTEIVLGVSYMLWSVEMSSSFRTDPEAYNDKKQKNLKRFYSKVVTKINLS